jgi:hypothetical protein
MPRKFTFRLDSVLRIYETHLEFEKAKLAGLLANERGILDRVRERSDGLRRQNEAIRQLNDLRGTDLRALSAYNLTAHTHLICLNEDLNSCRQSIRHQREVVLAHERQVKLLQRLKDKRISEWRHAVDSELERDAQEVWLAVHANSPTRL